jgi:hypothetical protein
MEIDLYETAWKNNVAGGVFDFVVIGSIFTAASKHFLWAFHSSPQHALYIKM